MEKMLLSELLTATAGKLLSGSPVAELGNISIDTRTLEKGDFYFAIKGKNFDGHNFLKDAAAKGAAGAVISGGFEDISARAGSAFGIVKVADTTLALGDLAAYYRRKWQIPLVAITGSNGKTTTKQMLYSILGSMGKTLCNHGNFNNQIGLPLTLLKITSEHKYIVTELGTSMAGEIARLGRIANPDIGVITNIGYTHLEGLKNREGVLAEKITLLEGLRSGGCAVLNGDDQFLNAATGRIRCEKILFGLSGKFDISADKVQTLSGGIAFNLTVSGKTVPVKLSVYGTFNVYNAMAAAAAAWELGAGLEAIKKGLESFASVKMRMEPFILPSGAILINDAYNSNPSSVKESVKGFIESFPGKEKIVVLGDMLELGDRAAEYHKELGAFLADKKLEKIFLFGPLMKNAFDTLRTDSVKHFADKKELASELKKTLKPGSVVLFKGSRGMALEEVIKELL